MKSRKIYNIKVAIIGAGPAGIAAAIQLKRAEVDFLLFEKDKLGGLLNNASLVSNYLGFPHGIKGVDLVSKFREHLKNIGVKILKEKVIKVRYFKDEIKILSNKNEYSAKYLIIASGTKPVKLSSQNSGLKIHYDLSKLRRTYNKHIIIIGGGDAAFDYAVSLAEQKNKIKILHRGSSPSCIPHLIKVSSNIKEIRYFNNIELLKFSDDFSEVLCLNKITNEKYFFKYDILIAAIGRESELSFADKKICEYMKLENNDRVFFAGDVVNGKYRQISVSTGDGLKCAMEIISKIKSLK